MINFVSFGVHVWILRTLLRKPHKTWSLTTYSLCVQHMRLMIEALGFVFHLTFDGGNDMPMHRIVMQHVKALAGCCFSLTFRACRARGTADFRLSSFVYGHTHNSSKAWKMTILFDDFSESPPKVVCQISAEGCRDEKARGSLCHVNLVNHVLILRREWCVRMRDRFGYVTRVSQLQPVFLWTWLSKCNDISKLKVCFSNARSEGAGQRWYCDAKGGCNSIWFDSTACTPAPKFFEMLVQRSLRCERFEKL